MKSKIYNNYVGKIKDYALNIIASAVMNFVLQIITYPLLANRFDNIGYGLILTVMGMCNTISVTFGNSLNNTRLIMNSEFKEDERIGEFNYFLLVSGMISGIMGIIGSMIFINTIFTAFLVGLVNVFATLRIYYSVQFRLKIDYKNILFSNLVTAIGYVVGTFLIINDSMWPLAFLIGEIAGSLYTLYKTNLYKDGIVFSQRIIAIRKKYYVLILSTFIANVAVYMDRFFLHPVLGDAAVSIYTVASIVGKCFGIVMLPISGVMLSYYSQKGYVMTYKLFIKQLVLMSSIAAFSIIVISPFSPWITRILYPNIFEEAKNYIFIANMSAIISILSNMLTPSILKFVETYWQVVLSAFYCVGYIVLGMFFSKNWGLLGFCWASLLINLLKCVLITFIGRRIKNS